MAAPKKTSPANQAKRQPARTDEQKAAALQEQSSAHERTTVVQGEATSPNYGGPYLLQYRAGETVPTDAS